MMTDIYNFIFDALSAAFDFFDKLITSVDGLWLWVSSFICMFLVTRMLLVPILGHMSLGSDVAGTGLLRRKGKKNNE